MNFAKVLMRTKEERQEERSRIVATSSGRNCRCVLFELYIFILFTLLVFVFSTPTLIHSDTPTTHFVLHFHSLLCYFQAFSSTFKMHYFGAIKPKTGESIVNFFGDRDSNTHCHSSHSHFTLLIWS